MFPFCFFFPLFFCFLTDAVCISLTSMPPINYLIKDIFTYWVYLRIQKFLYCRYYRLNNQFFLGFKGFTRINLTFLWHSFHVPKDVPLKIIFNKFLKHNGINDIKAMKISLTRNASLRCSSISFRLLYCFVLLFLLPVLLLPEGEFFLPDSEFLVKFLSFFEELASALLIKFPLLDDAYVLTVPFSLVNINDSKLVGVKLHKMHYEINNKTIE